MIDHFLFTHAIVLYPYICLSSFLSLELILQIITSLTYFNVCERLNQYGLACFMEYHITVLREVYAMGHFLYIKMCFPILVVDSVLLRFVLVLGIVFYCS